jgi:regulator of sigma E protease
MTTLLSFLFVIGVLVFVHELGHFMAARRLGVRVLTFSLGFGPKLLKVKRGDCEYCVSAIPLGGYVKMAGENPDDPRSGQDDEFLSRSKWQRFQILIAGPAMNILLAVALMAVVLAQGAEVPAFQDEPPVVGAVVPDSPASQAGVRPGDRILQVGGRSIETWDNLLLAIGTRRPEREVSLLLIRDGETISLTVRPTTEGRFDVGTIGVLPDISPIGVQSVMPGEPAERAGLQAGDVILEINGERAVHRDQVSELVARSLGREVTLTVRRGDEILQLSATPEMRDGRAMLGFYFDMRMPTRVFHPGPLEAVWLSVKRNVEMSGWIFRILGGLFTGETSVRQFQGPVAIAQLSGESAQAGWIALLSLMAIISLNLGIINLMPVPILDGGHIVIMALEGIARRDFSLQVKEKMLLAGFVVLMMLMVTVIYNDLTRITWIERLMPWRN